MMVTWTDRSQSGWLSVRAQDSLQLVLRTDRYESANLYSLKKKKKYIYIYIYIFFLMTLRVHYWGILVRFAIATRELLILPDQLLSPLRVSRFNVLVIFHNCVPEPIYTSKYREALSCIRSKYTLTRPRLEPKPLYPVSSAVNRRSRPSLKCA